MGRYDIALEKKKKAKKKKQAKVIQKKREGKFPIINNDTGEVISPGQIRERYEQDEIDRNFVDNGSEIIHSGPRSRNFTITGPNGYRISIPVRRLTIYLQETSNPNDNFSHEIAIRLSENAAQALLNDVSEGKQRYGYEPI